MRLGSASRQVYNVASVTSRLKVRKYFCIPLSGFLFASVLWCQTGKRLEIAASDQFGGNIGDWKITLFSDDEVLTLSVATREFTFDNLPANSHELEISSPGFKSVRIPITDNTLPRITAKLNIGEGSGPYRVCDVHGRQYEGPRPASVASYVPRTDQKHLIGTVTDAWDEPLTGAAVLIVQDEPGAPQMKRAAKLGDSNNWTVYSTVKQTLIATTTTNEKGEFQFEFPYPEVDLDPGWYEVRALRDGFFEGTARFWMARKTLTQLSPISLPPRGVTYSCDSPLIHH
jgi:hypothetical protein